MCDFSVRSAHELGYFEVDTERGVTTELFRETERKRERTVNGGGRLQWGYICLALRLGWLVLRCFFSVACSDGSVSCTRIQW